VPEPNPNAPDHPEIPALAPEFGRWNIPKIQLSRLAKSNAPIERVHRVGSSYVKAGGGSQQMAKTARIGRQTAGRLGGFLTTALQSGVAEVSRQLGQEFIGRSASDLLARLVDILAPSGAQNEASISRYAVTKTLEQLIERLGGLQNGLEIFNHLTPDLIVSTVVDYVTEYVYVRFLHALASRIEQGAADATTAHTMETEIHRYLKSSVRLQANRYDFLDIDWEGPIGKRMVDQLFAETYQLMEVWQ
jgi:hypothetical protein